MSDDFAARMRPRLEASLEPGEALTGVAAATHQKTERLKLTMMRRSPFGGASHEEGVVALAEWLRSS